MIRRAEAERAFYITEPGASDKLRPGTRLKDGRYRIDALIAQGGFAVVYDAVDVQTGTECAIKTLKPSRESDRRAAKKLLREAIAGKELIHRNLVRVFDHFEHDGRLFFVMERLRGWSLSSVVAKGPLGLVDAIEVATEITSGLYALHQMGIVHLDLKPDNLFVTKKAATGGRDAVKILDLGAARFERRIDFRTTSPQNVIGTVRYMSPEQIGGDAVDARSDIYSFGLILYEMITGAQPCEMHLQKVGRQDYTAARAYHELHEPPPIRDLRPECPPELEALVTRCLEKRVAQRIASAEQISAALDAIRAELDEKSLVPSSSFGDGDKIVIDHRSSESRSIHDLVMAHTDTAELPLAEQIKNQRGRVRKLVAPAAARDTHEDREAPFPELTAAFDEAKVFRPAEDTVDELPKVVVRLREERPEPNAARSTPRPAKVIETEDGVAGSNEFEPAAPSRTHAQRMRLGILAAAFGTVLGVLAIVSLVKRRGDGHDSGAGIELPPTASVTTTGARLEDPSPGPTQDAFLAPSAAPSPHVSSAPSTTAEASAAGRTAWAKPSGALPPAPTALASTMAPAPPPVATAPAPSTATAAAPSTTPGVKIYFDPKVSKPPPSQP